MSVKGPLNSLLTQRIPDTRKLIQYARSKKLDVNELLNLAMKHSSMVQQFGSDLNPLHLACIANKPDVVKAIIQEGYDVNKEVGKGDTYLRVALQFGNIPVANLLLDLGANPLLKNTEGKTAFEAALKKDKKERLCVRALNVLVEAGVSMNEDIIQDTQEKPLHIAVSRNLPSCVSFLLQKGADGNVTDYQGCTPLHIACYRNNVEMIKLFTQHKVKLYEGNIVNETPLLILVRGFYDDGVNALIEGGCDINKAMSNGSFTALHCVTGECNFEKVKYLVSLGADLNKRLYNGATPLHTLAARVRSQNVAKEKIMEQSSLDILAFLLKKGANVNATDSSNHTPLMLAVLNRYFRLAKELIKLKANLNLQVGHCGKTPFHLISTSNRDVINLALEYGADYNIKNRAGLTPYHCAIDNDVNIMFIKSFVQFGCPYNKDGFVWRKSTHGPEEYNQFFKFEKQFFRGIRENSITMVQEAVDNGAVVTGCSEECRHPLHLVAGNGQKAILTYLLENGYPSNTVNNEGETALFVAAKHGHFDICCSLLRFGACYNYYCEKCSKTPETIAAENGHKSIVDLFQSVARKFYLASKEENYLIDDLTTVRNDTYEDYLMYVNAINIKGETLMSTALRFNHSENAKEMMKLRISAST